MRVVLDTSVLISGRFLLTAGYDLSVAALSYAELYHGASQPGLPIDERALRQTRLERRKTQFGEGLPFDDAAAVSYGIVTALTAKAGQQVRPRRFDLLIAAVAHANGAGVVTENGSDFVALKPVMGVLRPDGTSW